MATPLSAFTGNAIYIDTMIPYMLLRGIAEAQPFFEHLERGEVLAYTSVLTFDELGYRLILALIKDHYEGVLAENLVRPSLCDPSWLKRPIGNHGATHSRPGMR